jgi:hypothetical protein
LRVPFLGSKCLRSGFFGRRGRSAARPDTCKEIARTLLPPAGEPKYDGPPLPAALVWQSGRRPAKCLRGEFFLDQYQQLELIEGIEFKIVSEVHFICNAFHSTPAPTVQPVRSFEASPTCAPEPVKIMGLSNWLRRGHSNLRPPCVRESPVRPEDDQSVKRPFCGVRPRAVFPLLVAWNWGYQREAQCGY